MATELTIPHAGESITEVIIGEWLAPVGGWVKADDPVATIETDKANMEVYAPVSGTVTKILKQPGETAGIGEVIGYMEEAEQPAAGAIVPDAPSATAAPPEPAPAPVAPAPRVMPAAARVAAEAGIDPAAVTPTGPGGRVLKEDVVAAARAPAPAPAPAKPTPVGPAAPAGERHEEAVPMTRLRQMIAKRLVTAQQEAAILTTFNEVDMSGVIALRAELKERFQAKHGVKLGFMSFFVKAAIEALKAFPACNAEIRGTDVVYKSYQDIGVAVGGGRGLVVPVLRDAERMSFADVERSISDFATRAKANRLRPAELQGGTFTISNGGVYGSMMSTPIINPPQVAILGMHNIVQRPVVVEGEIVIRPMMYVALSYDHRIIDGRESVSFLVRLKECVEAPTRILLEV